MTTQVPRDSEASAATSRFASDDIVEIGNRYYVLVTRELADENDRVLKDGDTFAVFDRHGDIKPVGLAEEGIYHEGTRYLSGMLLRVRGQRPLLLSSEVKSDNSLVGVDLTNPDVTDDGVRIPRGTVHIERTKLLLDAVCHERITVRNFGTAPITVSLEILFAADYVDIFEVRGTTRERRGRMMPPEVGDDSVVLSYEGLDGMVRSTRISFSRSPTRLTAEEARFALEIEPRREDVLDVAVACEPVTGGHEQMSFAERHREATARLRRRRESACQITTSNEHFNSWLQRSLADLSMMATETNEGFYPYAGVPWFSAPFGRDGIITALQSLWMAPEIGRGVLAFLADHQADTVDPECDAQPGKIVHEMRLGEMAALGEIPFRTYYGTQDATPLFVMLAAAYQRRTADLAFSRRIWPNVERALEWIDRYGDLDGDGFVEYQRQTPNGLVHQGWKDSHDAIFHADGSSASGPIAMSEIQGYVYAAKVGAAELAASLGHTERATQLLEEAARLQREFDRVFWLDDLGTYALALDGAKRPCRVLTSNAGQCLWTGIVPVEHAERLAETIMADRFFTGWGIRTVAAGEARYNPMSYHNGSVWPHDTAIIAAGLARYGFQDAVARLITGLFDASLYVDLARLPELLCGFTRRAGEGPTLYPVACAPQAWAAGAVFMLLGASMGLEIEAGRGEVRVSHGRLPVFIDRLRLDGLRVGDGTLDVVLERQRAGIGLDVIRREGDFEVIGLK